MSSRSRGRPAARFISIRFGIDAIRRQADRQIEIGRRAQVPVQMTAMPPTTT